MMKWFQRIILRFCLNDLSDCSRERVPNFERHVRCIAALAMKQVLVEEPNRLNTEL